MGEIPDAGQWVHYTQVLIVRVAALPCSRNEQADVTARCPVWIQILNSSRRHNEFM